MCALQRELVGTAEERRDQVLRAALEVIVSRGYAETRLTDVAERAGVSPALVVYYFKTKGGLLTEAMRLGEQAWYDVVTRHLAGRDSAVGRLEEIVSLTCFTDDEAEFPEPWSMWLDLWAQAAHDAGVAEVRRDLDARFRQVLRELVVEGQRSGEFDEGVPDDFAIAFAALLDGLAIQLALEDPGVEAEQAFELSMRLAAANLGFDWTPASRGVGHGRGAPS